MFSKGPNSDGSIFVLFKQEDKDFHQVKSWPPTQQLVFKSIIPNFWPIKGGICHVFGWLGCSDQVHALYFSLDIFL